MGDQRTDAGQQSIAIPQSDELNLTDKLEYYYHWDQLTDFPMSAHGMTMDGYLMLMRELSIWSVCTTIHGQGSPLTHPHTHATRVST